MNQQMENNAQFDILHVKEMDENGVEPIREITKQKEIEWEV